MKTHLINKKYLGLFMVILCTLSACDATTEKPKQPGSKAREAQASSFNSNEFSVQMRTFCEAAARDSAVSTALTDAYTRSDYKAIWINDDGGLDNAIRLSTELDSLIWDGINTERYATAAIHAALETLKKKKNTVNDFVHLDTLLTSAYLKASKDLLFGIIAPKEVDRIWYHPNDTVWNGVSLLIDSSVYTLQHYKSTFPTYQLLRQELQQLSILAQDSNLAGLKSNIDPAKVSAESDSIYKAIIALEVPWFKVNEQDTVPADMQIYRAYQYHNGLRATGKLDTATLKRMARPVEEHIMAVKVNLERMRWLPNYWESKYVLVNIPSMHLFFRKENENTMDMRVVVGKVSRPTPVLTANMTNVVFNPPWGVPPTILKKDVLPGITKSGSAYLKKKGLKAYDSKGKVIDANSITAANYNRYTYRQPPGARNALGEIKFHMPNKWDIYLHDTPHKEDFPNFNRALSSGCIRVQRPKDLAQYILSDIENKNFDRSKIDSLIKTRITRFQNIDNPIPVHIVYFTAFEDSTRKHIRYPADIYKKDKAIIEKMFN